MICWFCHWGWPPQIREIYDRAARDIDDLLDVEAELPDGPDCGESALDYGPAHIVWADENFDQAKDCLKYCDEEQWKYWFQPVLDVVRRSLRELMAVPESLKHPPAGYDDKYPENFPPTWGAKMRA